jgi:DNA invertase Pin-like site-specific DNA recombinase
MHAKKASPKRVALYVRVSTSEQTTRNQRRELKAVADRHGWTVVAIFRGRWNFRRKEARASGQGLASLMKAVARREFDIVAAWSVDRLGRSLTDLLDVLKDLHAKGVDSLSYTSKGSIPPPPLGRAMFQMMGVFAEFERAIIRERVLAGLARAREDGVTLGRRPIEVTDAKKVGAIRAARADGNGNTPDRARAWRWRWNCDPLDAGRYSVNIA